MDVNALSLRLAELCTQAGVPGAAVALTDGRTVIEAVHGVTSLRTDLPVTPETMFQVGSISKVYTATIVMSLVDQGKVALDATVQSYLPWFTLGDAEAATGVTVRHLLTHTGGFEGDDFTDTGRSDEALGVYVEGLAGAAQIHPLGERFSYCNSGYSVLGAIIEAVTGDTWDQAVQDVLAGPLSLTLGTLAEQVILQPHAVGHLGLPGPDGTPVVQVAPVWAPPRSVGPAGTICSSAADLLAFGRMHVDGGGPVLSSSAVGQMQEPQVALDDPLTLGTHWGLGWILPQAGVIGHDGATFGQYAFYRLHPESGTAMALLTNGPGARAIYEKLFTEFFAPAAGIILTTSPVPAEVPPSLGDLSRYVGDYSRQAMRIEVREADAGLDLTMVPLGPTAALAAPPTPLRFVPYGTDVLITAEPLEGAGVHMTATFLGTDGPAGWIHLGARATPRVPA